MIIINSGIYEIKNKIDGKKYIGRSKNVKKRWTEHKNKLRHNTHQNKHLQDAWNKYGEDNFEFNILEECSLDKLNEREIYYIGLYETTNSKNGYNWTGGGDGAVECNEIISKMKSEAQKNFYKNNPEKAKLRAQHAAEAVRTEEYRELRRQKTLKQFQNPEFYKKYRELRSNEEYRKKISESHKGLKVSQRTKDVARERSRKPVLCVETGIIYPSCRNASKAMPGNLCIQSAANGRRKTAGGYHWKFVEK